MMLDFLKNLTKKSSPFAKIGQSYFITNQYAKWTEREYAAFAQEAYIKNVIAHQSIKMISTAASSVTLKVYIKNKNGDLIPSPNHPVNSLLQRPNPTQNGNEFFESIYAYKQISGNCYILGVSHGATTLSEIYTLRPDKITIQADKSIIAEKYIYKVGKTVIEYPVLYNGWSQILHLKNFNPLNELYGLSSIEAASYSIDQHNQSGEWNQALLQNGARPSGAIIVNKETGGLTEKQYSDLKEQIETLFSGPKNVGKPMLLDGGLDWKEMSMTPRDMDFISTKHSSARDIALALGVPPQLLGIPGDNTYSNLQEARLGLWEQTIIPILENTMSHLSNWLSHFYNQELCILFDLDTVPALSRRREILWQRVNECKFMTINEKRAAVGLGPLPNFDSISNN